MKKLFQTTLVLSPSLAASQVLVADLVSKGLIHATTPIGSPTSGRSGYFPERWYPSLTSALAARS